METLLKVLSSTEPAYFDFSVVGADSWRQVEDKRILHWLEQNGSICLSANINIPICLNVMASCLVQNNIVVSVEYNGSATSELKTEFYVHLSHQADMDCFPACKRLGLKEYLDSRSPFDKKSIMSKYVSTYVACGQAKVNSMVRNFLKPKVSNIHSECFYIEMCYDLDGGIKLQCYLWPDQLHEINKQFQTYPSSAISPDCKSEYLNYIDRTISTTMDPETLSVIYNLSDMESVRLASIVRETQVSSSPCLPSLKTLLIEAPSQAECVAGFLVKINY